jgi:FkbH-like protein
MFEFDWKNRKLWEREADVSGRPSQLPRGSVSRTALLHWQEHCLECALPDCYSSCALFVARADQRCARFVHGIFPTSRFRGLFDTGADIRFRRWGKLEAKLPVRSVTVATHRRLVAADRVLTAVVTAAAALLAPLDRKRRLKGAWRVFREQILVRIGKPDLAFDAFVMECFSAEAEPLTLVLEVAGPAGVTARRSFAITPGPNFSVVPWSELPVTSTGPARILLYPERDAECRLVFTWLDFVAFSPRKISAPAATPEPAEYVKCVAWDLDNTLWNGTLIDVGPDGCRLRPEIPGIMRELDRRGILQTVASKNDHDVAWSLLERFGLAEYLLYPAINWQPKSGNLTAIAERLNIGVDSFAFVDDSPFERAEVAQALPAVRVYDAADLSQLLDLPELDVPVTEMSARRRLAYKENEQRDLALGDFGGSYLDFLRSCGLEVRLFRPEATNEVERCLELVQRSNQLNLSTRRYTAEEFEDLLRRDDVLALALSCRDRFGDYGVVGFAAVENSDDVPTVRDFVLSCRVAQKRVEHAFFAWLSRHLSSRGEDLLRAVLVPTPRNGPLASVFAELPFVVEHGSDVTLYELRAADLADVDEVVSVVAEPERAANR